MAAISVSTDINVDAISGGAWATGDSLTINAGATVTVNTNQTKSWGTNGGTGNCITINAGKLLITNSSTTTPIRFSMKQIGGAISNRVCQLVNGRATVEIQGNWIEIGTGSGANNQTMTLPTADHYGSVWVETASGSGVYEEWVNLGDTVFYTSGSRFFGLDGTIAGGMGKFFYQIATAASTLTQTGSNSDLFTTTIMFGDNINGAKVPTGAKVRVPNIVITDESSRTTFTDGTATRSANFTMSGGGVFIANICNFANSYVVGTQAQTCRLSYCSFTVHPLITECYDFSISHCVLAAGIAFGYYSSGWTANDLSISPQRRTWTTITGATIDNLVACYRVLDGPGNSNTALSIGLTLQYANNMQLTNSTFYVLWRNKGWQYGLSIQDTSSANLTGNKLYGSGIAVLRSSNNNIQNNSWSPSLGNYGNFAGSPFTSLIAITHDPATGNRLVNDTTYYVKLVHKRDSGIMSWAGEDLAGYLVSRTYACRPYAGGADHPLWFGATAGDAQVVLRWPRREPAPANGTRYEIYRSTTAGSLGSVVSTITSVNGTALSASDLYMELYNDTSVSNGTTYYYTLRKYDAKLFNLISLSSTGTVATGVTNIPHGMSPGQSITVSGSSTGNHNITTTVVSTPDAYTFTYTITSTIGTNLNIATLTVNRTSYTDSAQQEATPTAVRNVTNLCLQSQDFTNASWVKTNVTVTASTSRGPLSDYWNGTGSEADRLAPTAADSKVEQVIAGLTAGLTYTFSVALSLSGVATTANPQVTLQLQCTDNGTVPQTVTQTITVTRTLKRYWLPITLSTGATQVTVRIGGSSSWSTTEAVNASDAQFVLGSVPGPYVGPTTTTSLSSSEWLLDLNVLTTSSGSTGGIVAYSGEGGQQIVIRLGTTPTNAGNADYLELHVGTSPSFTPSLATLVWHNFSRRASAESETQAVRVDSTSNNNSISQFTHASTGGFSSPPLYLAASSGNSYTGLSFTASGGYNPLMAINVNSVGTNTRLLDIDYDNVMQYRFGNFALVPFTSANNSGTLVAQNIRSNTGYRWAHSTQWLDVVAKGVFGTKTVPLMNSNECLLDPSVYNTATIETNYTTVYDNIFYELYESSTEGNLTLLMNASAKASKPYTITAGTPTFQNDGTLLMGTAGDQIEYEWPHKIIGVSGFRSTTVGVVVEASTWLGAGAVIGTAGPLGHTNNFAIQRLSAIKIEYTLDTGSGYGAWKRLTDANLLAETISATTGFRPKFRFTAMRTIGYTSQFSAFVPGETINGETSGATAVVEEVFDYGSNGYLWVSSVTGTWQAAENIRQGVTLRAYTLGTSPYQIVPLKDQAVNNTRVAALRLFTTVDQAAKYPVAQGALTLTDLPVGTEVRIYDESDMSELGGIEATPGTTFTLNYDYYGSNISATIVVFSLSYQAFRLTGFELDGTNVSIPISLVVDRQFNNPT